MTEALLTLVTHSVEETEELGARIASLALERGIDFVALYGDLGVGKTALTRGIVSVITPGAMVCSPTYSIVNEYYPEKIPDAPGRFKSAAAMPTFHFDLYRIEDEDSLDSIGFFDYQSRGGFIVTEWTENIEDSLPERYFRVEIVRLSDDERRVTLSLFEL